MIIGNFIIVCLLLLILATSYIWLYQNKYPKIISRIRSTYEFFNFKKKILEKEFDFNNKSGELEKYITDPNVLKNFQNTVCKYLYTHLEPKPTTLEINQYFESIFLQKKLLFDGLAQLSTKKSETDNSKTIIDFVNFQVDSISSSLIFNEINENNWDIFQAIERILIYDPLIGFNILVENIYDILENEGIEKAVIYDWLAKNKGQIFNINNNSDVFKAYFEDLIEDIKNRISFEKKTKEEKEIVYQKPILSIDELLIPPMNKQIFKYNYSKIGIFDSNGNFTSKISNIKDDYKSLTKFPKNAYYKLFENLFFRDKDQIKYMKPFPANLIEDDIARLINEFLGLKDTITGNNINKRNPGTDKFDNIEKTLRTLKIEIPV